MKALVYTGTRQLDYRDAPLPTPRPGESLVRIEASGICGSDMHAWHGHDPRRVPPLILGHELAGRVEGGALDGRRVAVNPLIGCGACRDCLDARPNLCGKRDLLGLGRDGGYAEHVAVPTANLMALDESLDAAEASLMEPLAVVLHALALARDTLARPLAECRALVIGGGAIGVLAALALSRRGVPELAVAETSAARRETLARIGAGEVFDPRGEAPPNDTFELVVDAVGSGPTRALSSRLVRRGGTIVHVGLQDGAEGLDTRRLTLSEIAFLGSYTYAPADLRAALDTLTRGALGSLDWLERRSLADGARAFEDIDTGNAPPKIVLLPELRP